MQFTKPPKTFEEQLDLLIERGLQVRNREKACHYLSHINYYRLAAYWLPYEVSHNSHRFTAGTTFEQVLNHYLFDRAFRLHLLDAIECIEVSFRAQWAYHISHHYGAHGHLINGKSMRKNEQRWQRDVNDLEKHVQRSDEAFIKHYRNQYDEALPPAWVSCEVMSLGLLSRFYSNLRAYKVRQRIASTYQFDEGFLEGFMEHLSYLRNVCAHHNRLWNRHLSKKMPLPKGKPPHLKDSIYVDESNKTAHKIYNSLVVIQHLLTIIFPAGCWAKALQKLIANHAIEVKRMGFPEHWQALPIWQHAFNG